MKRTVEKKITRAVFELWVGIWIIGILAQAAVFFVNDKVIYSLCLWIGVLAAMASSYHMWWSLDRALEDEGRATKLINIHFVIRYLCLAAVLGIVGIFFAGYVLATFVGITGIKLAAYMQPVTRKIAVLVYGEEILPDIIENLDDEIITAEEQKEGGE